MSEHGEPRPHRSELWRNPDFMKLWVGRTISEFGSRITREGIPLTAVLMLSAQPGQMGVLAALGSAPVLLVGLLAGVWVDRVRRRPLLIGVDLARAALLATIPLAALLGLLRVGQLYVVIALAGALAVIFEVADQSYLPSLVERKHLVDGNSKLGASESVAEIAGPALAGVLVQLLTAPVAIAFDAVSFVASAVSVWLIRKPEPEPELEPEPARPPTGTGAGRSRVARASARRLWRAIGEGLGFVWRDPLLRPLALATATRAFFGNFYAALYAFYAVRELGISPALLGLLIGLGGVGALPGTLLAGPLGRRLGVGAALIGSLLAGSLFSWLTALAPGPGAGAGAGSGSGPAPLAVAMLGLAQLFGDCLMTIYFIGEVSLRQAITPDHLLGRMNASVRFLVGGVSPLGALLGGLLGSLAGPRPTLFLAAAGSTLAVAWLIWSPIRSLRQVTPWQPAESEPGV